MWLNTATGCLLANFTYPLEWSCWKLMVLSNDSNFYVENCCLHVLCVLYRKHQKKFRWLSAILTISPLILCHPHVVPSSVSLICCVGRCNTSSHSYCRWCGNCQQKVWLYSQLYCLMIRVYNVQHPSHIAFVPLNCRPTTAQVVSSWLF
jgi:hypothetical protein